MKESGEILYLFESSHLDDLLTHYGLQLKTSMLKTVAEHVCRKVRQSGQPVKVSFGYHYDAGTCSMYVSVDPLRVLRMTASQVEYVDNVVDGLLILPAGEPIAVDLESIRTSKLGLMVQSGSLMYDHFDATYADENICAEFNHQLVCTRILALFFTDLFTSRSLLILDGAEGRVARIKDGQYVPDTNIRGEALKMRNAVMTEDLGRSRNILIALKAQAEYNPPHILRLHDFAGFVLRCAVHEH